MLLLVLYQKGHERIPYWVSVWAWNQVNLVLKGKKGQPKGKKKAS